MPVAKIVPGFLEAAKSKAPQAPTQVGVQLLGGTAKPPQAPQPVITVQTPTNAAEALAVIAVAKANPDALIVPAPVAAPATPAQAPKPAPSALAPAKHTLATVGDSGLVLSLPAALAAKLLTPISGQGGWQTLLHTLQDATGGSTDEGFYVTLGVATIHRLIKLSVKHGGGGYQGICRWLVCLMVAEHGAKVAPFMSVQKGDL